jgi:hypothetical protein
LSWSSLGVALLALLVPSGIAAQSARELQAHGAGVFSGSTFVGGGVGFGLRSSGRARADIVATAGTVDGEFAGRGELMLTYHVSPYRRRGISPYAGGGVALLATAGEVAEYVLLLVGVESAPMRRTGWFAEVGVAGGVRVVVGVRVRWRSRSPR